jgi:hypothetical protein
MPCLATALGQRQACAPSTRASRIRPTGTAPANQTAVVRPSSGTAPRGASLWGGRPTRTPAAPARRVAPGTGPSAHRPGRCRPARAHRPQRQVPTGTRSTTPVALPAALRTCGLAMTGDVRHATARCRNIATTTARQDCLATRREVPCPRPGAGHGSGGVWAHVRHLLAEPDRLLASFALCAGGHRRE